MPQDRVRTVTAVILAAGRGERLSPITERIPKPLVKISNDSTILQHNLQALKGVTSLALVYIIVGYRSVQIEEYVLNVQEEYPFEIRTVLNDKYAEGNNVFSMLSLGKEKRFFLQDSDYIVLDGDIILSSSAVALINTLEKSTILTQKSFEKGEWYFKDKKYHISKAHIENYYMSGISFFNEVDFFLY